MDAKGCGELARQVLSDGRTMASGRTLAPFILILAVLLVVLVSMMASPSAGGAETEHIKFETPQEGSNVSNGVALVVEVSDSVENVSFYYRDIGDWMLIGDGVESSPNMFNLTWVNEGLPDGSYSLLANATLAGGGWSVATIDRVTVDNTEPRLSFLAPPSSQMRLNGHYRIIVRTDADVSSMDLFIDQGSGFVLLGSAEHIVGTRNWTYVWNTTGIQEKDDIIIIASAWDAAGNEGRTSVLGLEVDNIPPSATMVAPSDNATLDGWQILVGNTTEEHLADSYFEWRVKGSSWLKVGDPDWNVTLGLWVFNWNTYTVGTWDDVELRFVVVDDLGQRGYGVAMNITILDLPPDPVLLSPSVGDHLTGSIVLEATSDNDTVNLGLSYLMDMEWKPIGMATLGGDGVWRIEWDTAPISIHETSIRLLATDASGTGETVAGPMEVDNTPPAPRVIKPGEGEYHIFGRYTLLAISDRDTTDLIFRYEDGDDWQLCGEAAYNPNTDRWELLWDIGVRILDSAICATAVDEVGLTGSSIMANIELGLDPWDRAPRFTDAMPQVIYFKEDMNYVLELGDFVDDDAPEKLRVHVANEPAWLFSVFGENTTGGLSLSFVPNSNAHGIVTVQVYIVDPSGQWDVANLTVQIESVADPPYFLSVPPNLFVHPAIPYEFDYGPYVRDPDTDRANLSVLLPDDIHVSKNVSNPLSLIFLYEQSELGRSYPVSITVRDNENAMTNASILVKVTDDWVPEQRRPLPNVNLEEDQSNPRVFNLDDYFFDRDHDTLYYSYGNTKVNVVIGSEYPHPVGIYLPPNWYGKDQVTFRAKDPTGALLEDTISIFVNSTNDPPMVWKSPPIPQLIIHDNESYHFDLSPYVEDVDDELDDLTIYTGDPFATRSTRFVLGLRLSYPFRKTAFDIHVVISDPHNGSDELIINVRVTNDNYPPELRVAPPNVVVDEGSARDHVFDVSSAYDQDWTATGGSWQDLDYVFMCERAEFQVDMGTGWVSVRILDPDWNTFNGSHDNPVLVVLRVMDVRSAFTEYTFRLTVLPVNDPPVVSIIPPLYLDDGLHYVDLSNFIRDIDTPFAGLRFEVKDANNPSLILSHVSVRGELLVLNYENSRKRTDVIDLFVLDGDHEVKRTITVYVEPKIKKEKESSLWLVLLVAIATGVVAVYASRFLWGRYEPPSVSDVFLVYGDGVIIRHLSKRGSMAMDEDLAIAMLTAIQEFVQQSMRSAQLKSMQAGENNILIERDPDRLFYIAVIHTGTVSEELRRATNEATRGIRENFGTLLKKWDGNIAKFDGVERFLQDILIITHAHIPEGVRFEMEGINSIEPGKTFLFQGKDVTRTHNIFRSLVEDAGSGLLISRVHPQRLHPSVSEAGAECVWLSKTPTKRGVSPSNTTMILHEITTYVRDHEDTVVCLDGLEYLLVHNPEDEVVAFVNELHDMVQVDNFVMMVHVDPDALDDTTLARLSRNMVPVSDR